MHLTEQTDQPKPTVFPKCWASRNNGVNVIQKHGKGSEEGEAAGHHCYSSSFISMLVCLLFISLFLSFSFCLLGCSFSASSQLKGQTLVWMEYRITCLCVGVCLFNVDIFCGHFCVGRDEFSRSLQ